MGFGRGRRVTSLIAVLLAALLLAACGTTPPSAAPADKAPSAGAPAATKGSEAKAQEPKRGGSVIAVIDGDPTLLLPPATTGARDRHVASKIYEGLIRLDNKLQPQPVLATSWDISPDGKVWNFNLRQNVKWHDGQPFSAADVKFTVEEVAAKYNATVKSMMKQLESIETPDPNKIIFKFKEPFGPFMNMLNSTTIAIVPKHVFQGTDILKNPAALTKPVGTGPFKLGEWARGQHLILERNPDYWAQGKPYLDRLIVKIIPDPASREAALEAGEVDYIADTWLPRDNAARLSKLPGIQTKTDTTTPADYVMIFNVLKKPTDDRRFRQAVATAIDRNFMVDKVLQGLAKPSQSAINTELAWAYNPAVDYTKLYAFNPTKAKQLLDEAGLRPGADGTRARVRITFEATATGHKPLADVMRQNLKDVGIDLVVEGLERNVLLEKIFKNSDFDIALLSYQTMGDPVLGIQRLYITSAITKANFTNASLYSNPKVDELFAKGAAQATYDQRAPYYFQAQEILAQDLPTMPLFGRTSLDMARSHVKGLWKGNDFHEWWDEVWVDK